MKDKHIRALEKEVASLRRGQRLQEANDSLSKQVQIQQSMRITVTKDRIQSPGAPESQRNLTEADRIRLEGKISMLILKNELLTKQNKKYKASKLG